jgi:hypothetical protein
LALNTNHKKNERLSCGQKMAGLTEKKHKKTHCENQNKVLCLDFSFLVMPVTHLRSNPYGTPISAD